MADHFEISGNMLRYGPWTVAYFLPDVPATVRDRIEDELLGMDRDAEVKELRLDYEREIERLRSTDF